MRLMVCCLLCYAGAPATLLTGCHSNFLVQAEHEAPVTAIGLSPDGLTIAVGTENGAIGCLDVPTHQYRMLLRSHTDTINAIAVDTHR